MHLKQVRCVDVTESATFLSIVTLVIASLFDHRYAVSCAEFDNGDLVQEAER